LVHHDTDLYDLTVKTSHGTEVIDTTSSHLFWDPSLHYGWIPANHLKPGMHLKTPDGQTAVVVGGSTPAVRDGWMWDLTVPGNNDHDFYVIAGQSRDAPVLVHNSDVGCGPAYENPGHHDPSGGPNPYNPNKAVLPADAEEQFSNSIEIDGTRWAKVGSGRNAAYYRYFNTGNDTWHFSGSSNGVTQSGANAGIPLNRIPIAIRRLP